MSLVIAVELFALIIVALWGLVAAGRFIRQVDQVIRTLKDLEHAIRKSAGAA